MGRAPSPAAGPLAGLPPLGLPPRTGRWFDIDAFAAPPLGRFGTSSRGMVIGPGQNLWHGGIHKYFHFSDNPRIPKLRVEATATNAFNQPNWSNPVTNLSQPITVGTINGVGGPNGSHQYGDESGMRSMQLGIRVEW